MARISPAARASRLAGISIAFGLCLGAAPVWAGSYGGGGHERINNENPSGASEAVPADHAACPQGKVWVPARHRCLRGRGHT
jgi:hypothetical protein